MSICHGHSESFAMSEHNVVLIHIDVKFLDNSKIVRYMILSIAAL